MMDERIKKLWVEELRAHPERQGTGKLRPASHKRCCLGVLCDIFAKEHNNNIDWKLGSTSSHWTFLGQTNFLPHQVMMWAGLHDKNPHKISYHNDGSEGLPQLDFIQIARIIEKMF